jgi:hypothetical protein
MSGKDRRAPEEGPKIARLVRGRDGGARLVPCGNIVEGDIDDDGPPAASPSP